MRAMRVVVGIVAMLGVIAVGCSSTTMIHSNVPNTKVYLNGEYVGNTPYAMTDTKIVGSTTHVRLEAPGYEPMNATISRNEEFSVGACIGGLFLLVPFLWIMDYKPTHMYEMRPAGGMQPGVPAGPPPSGPPPYGPPPPPNS